jgi:hypothetical protein
MLSLVTPPAVSLVFAAMKPQIGLGVAIYWLLLAWELGQIRLIARWFAPALFMLAASLLAYGFWPLTFIGKSENPANVAAFPYLIPLGLYMLWTRRADASKASGIFFAPYHTLYSAVLPLTVLFKHPRLMFIAWLILWAYQLFEVMVK